MISDATAQTTTSSPSPSPSNTVTNTFEMDGQIGSLILGMPPNTKTVDISSVPFCQETGTNGVEYHTHQLSNFRINGNTPIQLSPDKSVSVSGLVHDGTNGNRAWDNVNATIDISKAGQLPLVWQMRTPSVISWDNKFTGCSRTESRTDYLN